MVDSATGPAEADAASAAGGRGAQVYDRILGKLTRVEIEAGARISVDALSRELEVSQTPIREALGRLEANGLVIKHHLRGYRATPLLTRAELSAMFEVRLLLEPFAAGQAAERRTADEFAELTVLGGHGAVGQGERVPAGYGEFATYDAQFHDLIARAGGNALIRDSLVRLHSHLHIFRLRHDSVVVDDAIVEHQCIVDAIGRGDRNVAEAAMRSHIERSRDRIIQVMDAET